jgi:prolyl-tRNA editing enzyme YbaK/EbsC (Cys-tRNA(Pro) deacylase)
MADLDARITNAEKRLDALEIIAHDPVQRVKRDLAKRKVFSGSFIKVPENYYGLTLMQRALQLRSTVPQLCKSIIFQNTNWTEDVPGDPTNAQYYLVVVQYQAKMDTKLLVDLIHSLRPPETRLPRKNIHFRLATEADNDRISGFRHNAVSPFGMLENIPIVICKNVVDVQPGYIFMGGGLPDVKLGVSVADFVRSTNAIVGKISNLRADFLSVDDD